MAVSRLSNPMRSIWALTREAFSTERLEYRFADVAAGPLPGIRFIGFDEPPPRALSSIEPISPAASTLSDVDAGYPGADARGLLDRGGRARNLSLREEHPQLAIRFIGFDEDDGGTVLARSASPASDTGARTDEKAWPGRLPHSVAMANRWRDVPPPSRISARITVPQSISAQRPAPMPSDRYKLLYSTSQNSLHAGIDIDIKYKNIDILPWKGHSGASVRRADNYGRPGSTSRLRRTGGASRVRSSLRSGSLIALLCCSIAATAVPSLGSLNASPVQLVAPTDAAAFHPIPLTVWRGRAPETMQVYRQGGSLRGFFPATGESGNISQMLPNGTPIQGPVGTPFAGNGVFMHNPDGGGHFEKNVARINVETNNRTRVRVNTSAQSTATADRQCQCPGAGRAAGPEPGGDRAKPSAGAQHHFAGGDPVGSVVRRCLLRLVRQHPGRGRHTAGAAGAGSGGSGPPAVSPAALRPPPPPAGDAHGGGEAVLLLLLLPHRRGAARGKVRCDGG